MSESIHIRKRFLRSVHLEKDCYDSSDISDYIITPQVMQALSIISEGLISEATSRAWTITGPYGTGKSAFALYLSRLLGNVEIESNSAWQLLFQIDMTFADDLLSRLKDGSRIPKPFLTVPITARRAPASLCLLEGLYKSLQMFSGNEMLKSISADIESYLYHPQKDIIDSRYVSQIAETLASLASESDEYRGIIMIVDELGKLFEYSASHPEQGDMFVIQEIAESSCRSGKTPMLFVGVLHQSFEQYVQYADILTRNEWAKIHGRFTDIAFIEPPEQMIRLVANAIEKSGNTLPQQFSTELQKLTRSAIDCHVFPSIIKESEILELCMKAYPLHPSVLAALPHLFRRFAQNERSLFSYLSSHEPFGFQDFASHLSPDDQRFIRLYDLFDYFIANFGSSLIRQQYARKWIEAADVLDRSQELNSFEIKVLKTIGILTVLGEISYFRSEEKVIQFALAENESDDAIVKECLQRLRDRSLITFRKFNQSYRIWEGSDIDVEERISEGRRRTSGQLGMAETIQRYLPQRPIVARRHSYEMGTLRFFKVAYIDGLINVSDELIIAIPQRIGSIHLALDELKAIHWVWENTPQLRDDNIARRELSERMNEVESALIRSLERLLDPREEPLGCECKWYYKGKIQTINAPRDISQLLSKVCDQIYCDSPRILNELINRRSLSTASAAARRNLIERMLTHAEEPLLGLDGYPPERSMYESILLASGLHREQEGKWLFSDPTEDRRLRFNPCWQALKDTVFSSTTEPYAIDRLFDKLSKPPYGIMPGVLPVLLCAFMLSYPDELSLYREGSFIPEPSIADFELLIRRPEMFAIAGYHIIGARKAVVERIAKGLNIKPSIVQVIKHLVRMVKSLPDHAWRTKRLSDKVLAVREAFNQARSPEKLLFYDLPKALNLPEFSEIDDDLFHVEQFFNELNSVIQEWSKSTSSVIEHARDILLKNCGFQSGWAGWNQLRINSERLERVVTHPRLLPFLKRVIMDGDIQATLESALAFIADRPPRSWTDTDIDRFPSLAENMGQLFTQAMQTTSAFDSQHLELTSGEYEQSQEILESIRDYIKQRYGQKIPNRVIKKTIISLLREFDNEPDQ